MSFVRRFAELASRNRMLPRKTPADFGSRTIFVSPDASLRWLRRNPWVDEGDLLKAVKILVKPEYVVWDLGANVGAFGLCAAHLSGSKVVMVEADQFLAQLLAKTAAANDDCSFDILSCAISRRHGVAEFAIAGRGRSTNGLTEGNISTQHGDSRAITLVPTLSADDLLTQFPAPAVIKIDLEGAEAMFVEGAGKLLTEIRPAIYIEVERGNRPTVFEALQNLDYEIRQLHDGAWIEVRAEPVSDDFYAIPAERASGFFNTTTS